MTILRDIAKVVNGRQDSTDERVGVLASDIPTGQAQPAFLLNDINPDFPDRLYSMAILTQPPVGRLYLDKAGAGFFTGAPAGTYTGTQRVDKYDPGIGLVSSTTGQYTIQVGQDIPIVTGVSVTPVSATGSQQFTASVQGDKTPSQAVTWERDGAGNISSTGYFTEPPKTTQVQVVTIRARSVADPSIFGTATVTIPALVAPSTVTSVVVSPMTANGSQQFTATVLGTNLPSQNGSWSIEGAGSITQSGYFTEPDKGPESQTITITFTSAQDPTKSGSALVIIPQATATVDEVVVTPGTANGAQQFSAQVVGSSMPSQSVVWSAPAGQVSASGYFTPPGQINIAQVIKVRATSVIDPTKWGEATVTIASDPSIAPGIFASTIMSDEGIFLNTVLL